MGFDTRMYGYYNQNIYITDFIPFGILAAVELLDVKIGFNASNQATTLYYKIGYTSEPKGGAVTSEVITASCTVYYAINGPTGTLLDTYTQYDLGIHGVDPYTNIIERTVTISPTAIFNFTFPIYFNMSCYAGSNSRQYQVTATYSAVLYFTLMNNSSIVLSKNTTKHQLFFLPNMTAATKGKMLFIKNITGNNNTLYIHTRNSSYPYTTIVDDQSVYTYLILNNLECVVLFHDTIQWYVANYQPAYFNYTNTSITGVSTNKIAYMSLDTVNVFDTSIHSKRNTGDNFCYLPNATAGKLCFVSYVGDTNSTRSYTNALLILTQGDDTIDDGHFNNNDRKLYIVTDTATVKNTGAVFISGSNTTWYFVGWYNTSGIEFGSTLWPGLISGSTEGVDYSSPTFNNTQIILSSYTPPPGYTITRNILLPSFSDLPTGQSRLIIVKSKQSNSDYLYASSSGIANVINEGVTYIRNTVAPSRLNYSCIWLLTHKKPGESFIHYYPVLTYG